MIHFWLKYRKTVLIFTKNCGFYGINSEVPTQACKSRMKRRSGSWCFQAISAQNSDRLFYVIIHPNGRFIKFFLHRLKEKRFLFPVVWFFVLSSKQKCLLDIMENGRFSTPFLNTSFFIPTRFRELLYKIGWMKTNDLPALPVQEDSVSCVKKIIEIAWELQ